MFFNEEKASPQLRQYHNRRQYYIFLMGNHCWICGALHDLQFDHIDPTIKIATISHLLAISAPVEVLEHALSSEKVMAGEWARNTWFTGNVSTSTLSL